MDYRHHSQHHGSAYDETSRLTWPAGSEYLRMLHQARQSRFCYTLDTSASDEDRDSLEKKVVVGICAMAKKSNSSSMKEIIRRLENFQRLQIVIFEEEVILNQPVSEWPVVNALVSFFSTGFPLDKAIAYKNLRQPFVVNDLEMQYILQDRTEVYKVLEEHNIPHPRYTVLDKEKYPECQVVETDDTIEINGRVHSKPFVEKPINAEDHNVYIYFPQSAGGGSTRLFRKVKDRSSIYSHTSDVRTNGAYLYEDFMPTDGTDVKIYTVGSDYQHAEARKSPCLDGKVERDVNGKEVRYPVLLSAKEKLIARKVVWAFGQNVCGFDLLRASGKCYVCDVNGFSFVKTSNKYYDDCARILGTLMLRAVCPTLHIPYPLGPAPEDDPVVPTTSGQLMELRCVVALVRHGDRTPKQKLKMEVKNKLFFDLFERHGGYKNNTLKIKHPSQLQEVLDIVRTLLDTGLATTDPDLLDKKAKLQQMKLVLEMYEFTGINRKVQLKHQPEGRPGCRNESPRSDTPKEPSLLLILKWGGELTTAGRIQAENLGKAFRTLYPGGQAGQFEAPGLGFLRLHSTFRHDLKIYSSDEGRVQMTAAAFAKGLLALEGELTPILVQMVKSSNTEGLLDGESLTCKAQMNVKKRLQTLFNKDHDFTEEDYAILNPTDTLALTNAMEFVKNPKQVCSQVYQMIQEITSKIRSLIEQDKTRDLQLYNGESWDLLIRRWAKLEKDFLPRNGNDFEVSKIPDIYDCIKYDLQHNQNTLQFERAQELFMYSKALADIIIPQEYGITVDEKLHIGQTFCSMFLCKICSDFQQAITASTEGSTTRLDSRLSKGVSSPGRFVRTRLYFSSESHIHSVLNILRYGFSLYRPGKDSQWERAMDFMDATAEFNYMSHVVFMLYEDSSKDIHSDERFHMELHFSPGAYTSCDEVTQSMGMGFRPRHQYGQKLPDAAQSGGSSLKITKQSKYSADQMFPKGGYAKNKQVAWQQRSLTAPAELGHSYDKDITAPTADSQTATDTCFTTNPSAKSSSVAGTSSTSESCVKEGAWKPQASSSSGVYGAGLKVQTRRQSTGTNTPKSVDFLQSVNSSASSPSSRNYKTVHMELHGQFHTRWSMPCLSCGVVTEEAKELFRQNTYPLENFRLRKIKPVFNHQALQGFDRVPEIHPLETLHNTLTLHEVSDFLAWVTSVQFSSPANMEPSTTGRCKPSFHTYRKKVPAVLSDDVNSLCGFVITTSGSAISMVSNEWESQPHSDWNQHQHQYHFSSYNGSYGGGQSGDLDKRQTPPITPHPSPSPSSPPSALRCPQTPLSASMGMFIHRASSDSSMELIPRRIRARYWALVGMPETTQTSGELTSHAAAAAAAEDDDDDDNDDDVTAT